MRESELTSRTERAVTAAAAVARDGGLTVTEPEVLYDVFSVVVHLRPSPVVARVCTVLPPVPGALDERIVAQRQELDVSSWLHEQACPVARPCSLLPVEPATRDGLTMTFWEYYEQDKDVEPDFARNAAVVPELHAMLRRYPRELPYLSCVNPAIPAVRHVLAARPDLLPPADLDRAEREWVALEPVLTSRAAFEAAFPGVGLQPIHGDSPPYNMVTTTSGVLFTDFELVTYGPVEWDLTFVGPDGERAYGDAAERLGLARLDERALRVMEAARMLQLVACLAMAPQLPSLAEGLQQPLETWRGMQFAGGLGGG